MNKIPPQLRLKIASDPYYRQCARKCALNDHECKEDERTGKLIEWEHALIFAGRQIQEKWAIVPICWWAHRGPGLVKEINEWLALNRATDEELLKYSKAINLTAKRDYLNTKYGTGSRNTKYNTGILEIS